MRTINEAMTHLDVILLQTREFTQAIDELGDLNRADKAELVRVLRYIRESLAPPKES